MSVCIPVSLSGLQQVPMWYFMWLYSLTMPGMYPQVHDVDQIDRYLNLNYIQGQKSWILSGMDMPKKGNLKQ